MMGKKGRKENGKTRKMKRGKEKQKKIKNETVEIEREWMGKKRKGREGGRRNEC